MDLAKYLTVLVVLCLEGGETGGGGKHHDHVKLHVPEFHHHDHHKKVITIHHHHHAPKKEHHHHHHHHQKPHIPQGHHYSHHHKKVHLKTHTVSKGGGHHGHGHHHKSHGHHGHHGHHHGHHDEPSYDYQYTAPVVPPVSYPNAFPSYEDDFISSVPSYDSGTSITGFSAPQVPQVRGVTHTVKQVKVFDSLPGALPNKTPSTGYEVTEEGEEGEEAFIPVNNLQNTYPATFGYVQAAASQSTNDPFGGITAHGSVQQTHDPFAAAPYPAAGGIESFTGSVSNEPQNLGHPSPSPSADYPVPFSDDAFGEAENSFTGSDVDGNSFISNEENSIVDDGPVTFSREAGIQQTTNTGNVQSVVY